MRNALLLTCLALAALPTDDPIVARAGDTVFRRSEYAEWVVARYGTDYIAEFVHDQLVLAEAARRGLMPDAEQLEAGWEAEYQSMIVNQYHGDPEEFAKELRLRDYDLASYKARRQHRMLVEFAEANMARADRIITEDDLRRRFTEEYGEDGENISLAVLFYSAFQRLASDGKPPDFAALRGEARARAETGRAALVAGRPLAELVADSDRPDSEEVKDGVLGHYRTRLLGAVVEKAVASLDNPGDVSPVIDVFDGSYVLQLLERRPVTFEVVRDELARMLREAPMTSEEYSSVRAAIVAARQPEILLH